MNPTGIKVSGREIVPGDLNVSFGDVDWQSPVCKTIRSFFETTEGRSDFARFVQEILNEAILLAEIIQRKSLHKGILCYHFEQVGFLGASVDVANNRVVLLRIRGELFAVRQTAEQSKGKVAPLVEISGVAKDMLLQVLDCQAFLQLWSEKTGNASEDYDTDSSIQPYLRSLIKCEPIHLHGRSLKVETILGQGLEGTVFRVRDVQTQQPFALKATYKDLRELCNYWSAGLEQLRKEQSRVLSYLCEFHSCEPAGKSGSTLLMQYIPVASLQSLAPENRLANGLRILADVVNSMQALHRIGVCHGDLGVSNVFIQRHADGCNRAMLIDPHPDVCSDFETHRRKDKFGMAHILYWIVTGKQWPEGTYPYMLRVMANDHNPGEGTKIFSDKPSDAQNEDCVNLHAAAVRCLCDLDAFDAMVEAVKSVNDRLNYSAIAKPGRLSRGSIVTGIDTEHKIARALKPIGSGVFMPLFSLPGYFGRKAPKQREYGMGDSGPAAREFVKLLRSIGQRFWMLLPISPTDQGNCPYRADSSFAISINTISPEDLLADGWITQKELERTLPMFEDFGNVPLGDEKVFAYKRKLLGFAFGRRLQKSKANWQDTYESFICEEAGWLDAYVLYKTIESKYPVRWIGWPKALRDADPEALDQFARTNAEAIEQEKFYQFLAQHYFLKLRRFAEEQGIYMIGDMPAYSMHGSADVWAYRQAFELAENGERTRVAGAPPDVFDAQGQGWNHPMYRWDDPATIQFLKRKYLRMKQLFANGFVRDDHIIGKVTPWGYTFGQPPAQGHRVTGAFLGNPLFDAILEEIPDLDSFLIGEDLGILTVETQRVMQHYGFMGMKVLQFMPFNEGAEAIAGNMYTPGNYSEANVILLGTHDAPVIREWWRNTLNDVGRYHFEMYLQNPVADETVAAVFAEFAMKQSSHMMIHQMPDIIVNGNGSVGLADARMNDPSNHQTPEKNWSWRLRPDAFGEQTRTHLKKLTESTNRTPENAIRRLKRCWPTDAVVTLSANIFKRTGKASKRLIQQLDSIVSKGLVRHASLGSDCLSAVYRHLDGELYLLLSTDCSVLEEQAVSLIHGLETYMQQMDSIWQTPLEGIDDEALLEYARACVDETEQSLRRFALLSTDALREEMITFIGCLLDASATDNRVVQKRLQSIEFSADESKELADRLQSAWTDLWVTYEQRGMARRNIIEGLLTGQLHGSRISLRDLRWRLARAYSQELSATGKMLRQWEALVTSWAKSLDVDAVKSCLFGISAPPFFHDLDTYGKAEGLSGLLGLMRKARRKEQTLEGYYDWFHEYTLGIVSLVGSGKLNAGKEMLQLFKDICEGGSAGASGAARASGYFGLRNSGVHRDDAVLPARAFELLLEIVEQCLIVRLGALKPSPGAVNSEFPAELDLQTHSYHSDCGGQSVARIIFEAYDRGLKTIALTDHQCFDGIEQALEIGDMLGVQVIPAIELYTGVRKENRIEQRRDILVYFPDVPRFLSWWRQGLDAETWQLFNDGWNRKLDGSKWGDVLVQRVTDWARAHGGVSVLAHPGLWSSERFHQDSWSFEAFEQLFTETGLAGIEISHSRLPFEENTLRFVPLVQHFNQLHPDNPIVFTMGTDSHTPEGIGRANLTEAAVMFIAETFAPEGSAASALRKTIVERLHDLDSLSGLRFV